MCFSLMINNLSTFSSALSHSYLLLKNTCLTFSLFLIFYWSYYWTLSVFYIAWIQVLSQIYMREIDFPVCNLSFLFLNDVFFSFLEQKILIFMASNLSPFFFFTLSVFDVLRNFCLPQGHQDVPGLCLEVWSFQF